MKYSCIFDKNYQIEDKAILNEELTREIEKSKMLLRTHNVEIFNPEPDELQQASSAEVNELMQRTSHIRNEGSTKRFQPFHPSWHILSYAALFFICIGIGFYLFEWHSSEDPKNVSDFIIDEHQDIVRNAIFTRDASILLEEAKKFKKYEHQNACQIQPGSKILFRLTAIFASAQQKEQILQEVFMYTPELKAENMIAFSTRGDTTVQANAFLKLKEIENGKLENLQSDEYPLWGAYIGVFYPQMQSQEVERLSCEVNSAIQHFDAVSIGTCALRLPYPSSSATPEIFQAQNLFFLAVKMAISFGDTDSLKKLIGLYERSAFKNEQVLHELREDLAQLEQPESHKHVLSREDFILFKEQLVE